jgi:hypothetical protein
VQDLVFRGVVGVHLARDGPLADHDAGQYRQGEEEAAARGRGDPHAARPVRAQRQRLGRCDYHEHLFQISPLLPGDELDEEEASAAEAASLRLAGVNATRPSVPQTPAATTRRCTSPAPARGPP